MKEKVGKNYYKNIISFYNVDLIDKQVTQLTSSSQKKRYKDNNNKLNNYNILL